MGGGHMGTRQRSGRSHNYRTAPQSGAIALRATTDPDQVSRDHTVAAEADLSRDFACLVAVSHLSPGDDRQLRLVMGVTGVIDAAGTADVHMIINAPDPRSATRLCVELISARLPQSVVTVAEIVDYDHALLAFLEQHGEHPDDVEGVALFDDGEAVAHILDRG